MRKAALFILAGIILTLFSGSAVAQELSSNTSTYNIWLYSLVSVIIVGVISLVGVFTLSISTENLRKVLLYFVSFSAGALMGDAFIHLLPEIVEEFGFILEISLFTLSGIVVSFSIEKLIHWKHSHASQEGSPHPYALMNLFGDGVHNFIDGIIIGASYLISIPVGIATTLAVILHEIPQEIGDFGVLLHGGFSRKKALTLNFFTALTAIVGVVISLILSSYIVNITLFLIPFAAGSFIYIAGSDLIPQLQKEVKPGKSLLELIFFLLGIGIMFMLLYVG